MPRSSGLPAPKPHAITASCRRRAIWTISCGLCSTRKAWALPLPIQLLREPASRNASPSLQTTRGIAFSTKAGVSAYVDLEKFSGGVDSAIGTLRDVLSNGLIEKSVHDLKRAVGLLDRFNITLEGVKDDTFLAAYLLDPNAQQV